MTHLTKKNYSTHFCWTDFQVIYVSRPLAIKRKTLFLKIEFNAFLIEDKSTVFEKKRYYSNISKIKEMVRKLSQLIRKPLF